MGGHREAATAPTNGFPLAGMSKGDVCIFDYNTYHRSLQNETGEDRYAYAAQYMADYARKADYETSGTASKAFGPNEAFVEFHVGVGPATIEMAGVQLLALEVPPPHTRREHTRRDYTKLVFPKSRCHRKTEARSLTRPKSPAPTSTKRRLKPRFVRHPQRCARL